MSKNLTMSFLLDFYGDVLPENQREAMDMFYNGDLSLSEISEICGITRQGVRDRIVKGERTVTELESKLGLAKRFTDMKKDVDIIISGLNELRETGETDVSRLIEAAKRLEN